MNSPGPAGDLEYRDIAEPQIVNDTQLKVAIKAAGVNPIDIKLRKRGLFYPQALPAVLGCDGAGIVVETGKGVSRFKEGDEVWFCHGGLGAEQGNYAEYTVVDENVAQSKPASLTFAEAAAAPLILITAWEALFDRAHLQETQSVLIHAGAGGVGHVAIQLAKLAGARVCTTVSSTEKAEFARILGADEIILYKEHDFVEAVNAWTNNRGVDVALDTVGGRTFSKTVLAVAHYGDLITLLEPETDVDWKEVRLRNLRIGFELMLTPLLRHQPSARKHHGEILQQCAKWFDSGRLKIDVATTLPLAQAEQAHRLIEQGHMQGKVVLTV